MKNSTELQTNYSNTNISLNHIQYNSNTSYSAPIHDMSGTLGYGVGRVLREGFDYVYNAWQNWLYPRPSVETAVLHREAAIYRQGLEAVVMQLDAAIENLRKNPRDPASLERVKRIINDKDYAAYFKPAKTEKLRGFQARLFKPIHEKVQRFKVPHLKEIVQGYLSVLQTETTPLIVDSTLPIPTETLSGIEIKRSIAQQHAVDFVPTPMSTLASGVGFQNPFDLSSLNGINGFAIKGLNAHNDLGFSVRTAGDINGDSFADLVLGASGASPGGRASAGTAYVLFGKNSNWSPQFNLMTLNGTNGFVVEGLKAGDNLGRSVSTAGDVNGDGFADLVLGADTASPGGRSLAGTAYVLFGKNSSWSPRFNLTTLNGSNGFIVEGLKTADYLGNSVSTAGDVNGDGFADLVLGAYAASPDSSRYAAGTVYVLFGKNSTWSPQFNLMTLNGSNGFAIEGLNEEDTLGWSVSTAGDVNRDGFADLVLAARGYSVEECSLAGTVYVLFGRASGWSSRFNLTTLNGSNGFAIEGLNTYHGLGLSVSTAGDVNGDGFADLVLGAQETSLGEFGDEGAVYVLFGKNNTWSPQFNLTTLNGSNGFIVEGLSAGNWLGSSVCTAGDVNGDGFADLLLGASGVSPGGQVSTGTAYVLFGKNSTWSPQFNLMTLNGNNGFVVDGLNTYEQLGISVSMAGDVNGDGKADFVLGATNIYSSGARGAVYVIFGKNTGPTPTPMLTPFIIAGSIIGGLVVLGGLGYVYRRNLFKNNTRDDQDVGPSPLHPSISREDDPLLPEKNAPVLLPVEKITLLSALSQAKQQEILEFEWKGYEEKSWHFDPQTKAKRIAENKIYELVEATDKDKHKVIKFYQHQPVSGYDIASIEVIYNPNMNHKFALYLAELQQRDNNPAFVAKWPTGQENKKDQGELQENIDWRGEVHQQFQMMGKPYQDSDYPAVSLLPMWHGTKTAIVDSIFRSGYASLATTDNGFFGKGIYGAHEAEYSFRIYAKEGGALILNWTACFSAYPVIDGDMKKLEGKGSYSNYDAHFVPVTPRNPNNPNEDVYYPTKPNEPHQYTELVVFQSAACLPRYLVQLQPTLPKALSLNAKQYPKTFFPPVEEQKDMLYQVEKQNPYQPPSPF